MSSSFSQIIPNSALFSCRQYLSLYYTILTNGKASYACRQLPQYPLLPEVHFHWLAVQGTQPLVPQNPEVVVYDAAADTSGLPREVAYFYTKLTQLVLAATAADSSGQSVRAACALLRGDSGLQSLAGYLCRFVFVQIRRNLKHTHVLHALLQVIQSLVLNPSLNLESCLHQLLPSLLSCIVGAKIGNPSTASNPSSSVQFPVSRQQVWSELQPVHIRQFGALVVQSVLERYGAGFPDRLPRVCKTYLQAATTPATTPAASVASSGSGRALAGTAAVRYGGIVGLGMLGERVMSEVLLPNINTILLQAGATGTTRATATVEPVSSQHLIGRKGGASAAALLRRSQRVEADGAGDSEEVLIVSIVNWYVRRSMKSVPSLDFLACLRTKIVPEGEAGGGSEAKRRRVEVGSGGESLHSNGHDDGAYSGWDQFADRNIEKFVPHYVTSSVNLPHCSCLFI